MDTAQLRAEQKKIVVRAIAAAIACVAVTLGAYLLLPSMMAFPADLAERIAFAVQADVFVLLWVVLGVRMVSRVRFYSKEDNRGSAYTLPSPKIAVPRAFLQNTLEQAVIAVGAHLALSTLVYGPALSFIPAAVFLFAIGRITFLLGYPYGAGARAFGMVMTTLPSIVAYGWAVYLIIARSL